ncbi:MAG: aminotransferase class I/II-fold pyridoxal phosphate-dependent enzyme [Gammaproteobacteria bacterium]|nr:aminotransferase class I/II-fold pyridoxal phosphate-dependent enzyme [Gammaproteobacteria bacterium]
MSLVPTAAELNLLRDALGRLAEGFDDLPDVPEPAVDERTREVLLSVAERTHDNYPYHHPLYAGQMLKPPHRIAQLSYWLATCINPNNHALDGGRASSAMEKEAVANIAAMFGMPEHLGHLTSGGTMANLEALFIAGQEIDGVVLASSQSHYTHSRISGVLRLPFESVAVDERARMDLDALEARLKQGGVSVVVATLGTTALGAVDPLPEILALAQQYGARVHVDAAYGGYFTLSSLLDAEARAAFDAIAQADSIVIDPHKHGLQPYGCGCVLFRDPQVGRHYSHDSPYTYFSSDELHLGEISLECSRAGASAVALWATQQLLPMERGGEFAQDLDRGLQAAREFHAWIEGEDAWQALLPPQLDILAFSVRQPDVVNAGVLNQKMFQAAAEQDLHIAVARLPRELMAPWSGGMEWNEDTIAVLRTCLMKPEHADWLPELQSRLEATRAAVLATPAADS